MMGGKTRIIHEFLSYTTNDQRMIKKSQKERQKTRQKMQRNSSWYKDKMMKVTITCSKEWLFDIHRNIFSGGSIPSANAHNRKNRQIKRNFIHISLRVRYAAAAISNTVNCAKRPELMTAKKGNLCVRYSRRMRQAIQRRPYIHGTRFWCSIWLE